LTPLKQAGTIVQVVGKVVGQPAAEKSGKFVADLMEEPEGKMKKVLNTTTRACNNVSALRCLGGAHLLEPICVSH
jgi:hypothetical protein